MTIHIDKEVELNFEFSEEEYIEKVIVAAMDYVECPYEAEVNVLFTDNIGIQEMNLEYREIDFCFVGTFYIIHRCNNHFFNIFFFRKFKV